MEFIEVVVRTTDENFDAEAYLLMNADVAAAQVDPLAHFRRHGRFEKRSQINKNYLAESVELRRRKFELFSPLLTVDTHGASTFPISVEGKHYELHEYQSESSNDIPHDFSEACRNHPDKRYVNLGSGLSRIVFVNCMNIEVYPSMTTDLVVPPTCTYPVNSGSLDGIGCFAVLEHTRQPWLVVSEMHRMLKQGGMVWIDWPFLQPVHGYPSHYFNATREGLRTIFEDCGFATESIQTNSYQGLDYTLTWALGQLMQNLPESERTRLGKMKLRDLLSHRPGDDFWRQIVAETDDETREALACGNTLIATKR